jgi:hypothetical protein
VRNERRLLLLLILGGAAQHCKHTTSYLVFFSFNLSFSFSFSFLCLATPTVHNRLPVFPYVCCDAAAGRVADTHAHTHTHMLLPDPAMFLDGGGLPDVGLYGAMGRAIATVECPRSMVGRCIGKNGTTIKVRGHMGWGRPVGARPRRRRLC